MIDIQAEFKKRQTKLREKLDVAYVRYNVRSWFDEPNKKMYLQALDKGRIKSLELAKELTEQGSRFYEESNYREAVDYFRCAHQLRIIYFGEDTVECEDSLYHFGRALVKLTLEQGGDQLQTSFDSISAGFTIRDSHKPSVAISLFLRALAESYAEIGDFVAAKQSYIRACIMALRSDRKDGPITLLDMTEMYFQTGVCTQISGGENDEVLYYNKAAKSDAKRILLDLNTTQSEGEDGWTFSKSA